MKNGIQRIAAERKRQVKKECWTDAYDAQWVNGELAMAAASYAIVPEQDELYGYDNLVPIIWPWDETYWKPSPENRIRDLEKAGALIAAEIDRLLHLKRQNNAAE